MEELCWDYKGHTICQDNDGYFIVDDGIQLISYDEALDYIDEIAINADLSEYDDIHTYIIYFVDRRTDRKSSVDVTATSYDEAARWVKKSYCPNCRITGWELYK